MLATQNRDCFFKVAPKSIRVLCAYSKLSQSLDSSVNHIFFMILQAYFFPGHN